jgi:hypothetical protein
MTRTFTTATDDSLINLIQNARTRLALIAPALTTRWRKPLPPEWPTYRLCR